VYRDDSMNEPQGQPKESKIARNARVLLWTGSRELPVAKHGNEFWSNDSAG